MVSTSFDKRLSPMRRGRLKKKSSWPYCKYFLYVITCVALFAVFFSGNKDNDNVDNTSSSVRTNGFKLEGKEEKTNETKLPAPDPKEFPIAHTFHKANLSDGAGDENDGKFRILYIMTTLTQYDKGSRGTQSGADRLQNMIIPLLKQSIGTMVEKGWTVDLVLVLGYAKLEPERLQLIKNALQFDLMGKIEVWEDAIPYFYPIGRKRNTDKIELASHGLARQHRYVIKDKLPYYDFFIAFEDDMKVTADHVLNFLEMSSSIEKLSHQALIAEKENKSQKNEQMTKENNIAAGQTTAEEWKRYFPGLLRVEVNINHGSVNGRLKLIPPQSNYIIPQSDAPKLNANICCSKMKDSTNKQEEETPISDLFLWETNIHASGVRRLPPPLDWVVAMPVEEDKDNGSYWSGHGHEFKEKDLMSRPRRKDATFGQQAGLMATKSQIEYLHNEACPGEFLPPFTSKYWRGDSLKRHSVEFWSGGYQLFGTCGLNRILSMDPERFSKQIIHHMSNNKQYTKNPSYVFRVQDFFAQLYTVKQAANEWIKQNNIST